MLSLRAIAALTHGKHVTLARGFNDIAKTSLAIVKSIFDYRQKLIFDLPIVNFELPNKLSFRY